MLSRSLMVEDLGVELRCRVDATVIDLLAGPQTQAAGNSRDIAVYHLGQSCYALVGGKVEDNSLHVGAVNCVPLQVIGSQLSELR